MKILNIDAKHWVTPLIDVEDQQVGKARLRKTKYRKGVYPLEGVQGYDYYKLEDSIQVTRLQILDGGGHWQTWMMDDPLHWLAMKQYTDQLKSGSVLCAGLGLGLMVFRLLQRQDITEIHIIEQENDVIQLMLPLLPTDSRIGIANIDYYSYLAKKEKFDNIFWDLAVGQPDETRPQFDKALALHRLLMPETFAVYFGMKESNMAKSDQRIRQFQNS